MLSRLQTTPLHLRLSYLLPALFVLLNCLVLQMQPHWRSVTFAQITLLDATVSSALVVWLCTPRGERSLDASILTVARGTALAALAFPEVRHLLWLEVLLLVFPAGRVLAGLRRPLPEGYAELDDLERLYAWFGRLTASPWLARAMLFDRALFGHLLRRPSLAGGQHFGTRRGANTGATFIMLGFLGAVEGLLVHVLLARVSETAAWVTTGLSVVGMVWMMAYGRALVVRPITVGCRRLYLRSGLHWTASTLLSNVASARPYRDEQDRDTLNIAVGNVPNVALSFHQPVRLYGLYWIQREVMELVLHVDDPVTFLHALAPWISQPETLHLP